MIALKREMPKTCLDCPNLHTIIIPGQVAGRACAAAGMNTMYVCPDDQTKDNDDWMNFPKPKWCPLIEIVQCKDCRDQGSIYCPMVEMNTEGVGDIVLNSWSSPHGFCHYGKKAL